MDHFLASVEQRAYRMAMIASNNREDALDIVQDAMVRLVKRYGDRDEQEWGPLFHRIVQSVINDWYRRSTVRNRWRHFFGVKSSGDEAVTQADPLENQFATAEPGPSRQLANRQAIEQLDVALHQLPMRQQQVFLLRQWEGLSVRETAKAVGCGEGSVKTHYSRAMKALREMLKDYWQEANE